MCGFSEGEVNERAKHEKSFTQILGGWAGGLCTKNCPNFPISLATIKQQKVNFKISSKAVTKMIIIRRSKLAKTMTAGYQGRTQCVLGVASEMQDILMLKQKSGVGE